MGKKERQVERVAVTVNPVHAAAIQRLRATLGDGRGALLPWLHALQAEFGYIDDQLVPVVAEALNLSRADVHGVVTFYHDFRRQPA
ncbi:NAD(P)H-dependent oxidoreductase subunit E, partial [Brevundimonas sp.]|uniref:NAD(P)H-dependent oxidoreductase subunit E n=1 Tax=Brevundimonas sp. TaxID=1871086 RepID=UPI001A257DC0|nr:NAD(P)H-dependent oxidoreductase subunit E [Brevundimonas sp.]